MKQNIGKTSLSHAPYV